ncbi:MAG: acyl-CoA dehydrogenase family protein [Maricaulaceae bacterium]
MIKKGVDADVFDAFLEQIKRYVRERLVPAEDEAVEHDRVPDDILKEMTEMGLFGVTIPEEYGGSGFNISQYISFIQEISWALPAFRSIISMNVGMTSSAILNSGTEEQKSHWLPKLAAGDVACFALTEPDSGSDAAALTTRAVRDGDDYILNGSKRYISNAPFAKIGLIMARTEADNLPKNAHVSAFIIPMDAPGVTVGKSDKKMGQSGSRIADVILEDVRVPASALLGGVEGKGFQAAMYSIDIGRFSVAAASTGYAKRMLEYGLDYAMERKAFGNPIANFQLIQAMLSDSKAEIYAAECMIKEATAKADRGEKTIMEAACTKMFASEMCGRVADRVVQILGGAGYLQEYQAERFFRDCRLYRIYEGTTQIQQLVIAKQMIRQYNGTY